MTPARWRLARQASQGFFLVLFFVLIFWTFHPPRSPIPVELFLRLDPLANVSSAIAARDLSLSLLWALPVVLLTLALGRVFCGWICPMGTLLDVFRLRTPVARGRGPRGGPAPARRG